MRKYWLFTLIGLAVAAAIAAVAAGSRRLAVERQGPQDRSASAGEKAAGQAAAAGGAADQLSRGDAGEVVTTGLFRRIAREANPVVVAITTESRIRTPDITQFFGPDDFFWRFFGGPGRPRQPREQIQRALGSGFLISSDGEIITNNHVVAGAEQIRVALYGDDRTTYVADIVGRDPLTDSALIKLKNPPRSLQTAKLGNSDAIEPGDWVMAIGNPFQLGHTVTVGVISYKGRPFATTEGRFQNMLQTDASINPGNSGGPLIDTHGEVVGVNTAILSGQGEGGNIGIGFAVPINTVTRLLPQLRKGAVHRGMLGVQILSTPITDDEARSLGLPRPEGAIVSRVEPGSPADQAGLRAGDVIVSYNGRPVQNADRLTEMVADTPAGARVSITFYRNRSEQRTTATIQELRLEEQEDGGQASRGNTAAGFGLSLGDLTPELARELRLPGGTQGAVVENVEPFTPAAAAGLRRGDVILEVNQRPVRSAAEAARELRAIGSGQPAFLLLSRQGTQQFIELRKP